ncbi:MAG: Acetyltransferase (GNAT) domain-containing protein [Candidatus Kentron sp. G]|nr:MAG: Acetyltransferase (GNAT) domain-containing protein [Candidatus Kentron sp. G]VFM99778.1 MAG: Acetyltransferase (GNAT) domain-containing protein [Candidatus Kentron sp. G]VFN01014.1 MAG: Acetyltransferase (GNAT) domain-containing protein [Candidatus Kentron sp. G]
MILLEKLPTPYEYNRLRKSVGWHCIDNERAETALNSSLFSVCAIGEERLAGLGRVTGDGAVYFYVQDIIVLPEFQGSGTGRKIMERVMGYLDESAPAGSGAFIGLMTAPGTSGFYHGYGFRPLPDDSSFMCLWRNGH